MKQERCLKRGAMLLSAMGAVIVLTGCGKKEEESSVASGTPANPNVQSAAIGNSGATNAQTLSGTQKPRFDNTK